MGSRVYVLPPSTINEVVARYIWNIYGAQGRPGALTIGQHDRDERPSRACLFRFRYVQEAGTQMVRHVTAQIVRAVLPVHSTHPVAAEAI